MTGVSIIENVIQRKTRYTKYKNKLPNHFAIHIYIYVCIFNKRTTCYTPNLGVVTKVSFYKSFNFVEF